MATDPGGEFVVELALATKIILAIVAGAAIYSSLAYANRNLQTGKWEWKFWDWKVFGTPSYNPMPLPTKDNYQNPFTQNQSDFGNLNQDPKTSIPNPCPMMILPENRNKLGYPSKIFKI